MVTPAPNPSYPTAYTKSSLLTYKPVCVYATSLNCGRGASHTKTKKGGRGAGRRVTLTDVAEKAGVNRATASLVLNNRPNCWASEATRRRIRKAATTLGYRPNLAARALRSGRAYVIGFASPGISIASAHSRAGGITDAAADSNYTITLSSHSNDSESEDVVIQRLVDRGVDGLAVYPVDPGLHEELRRLIESGFPVVTFEGENLLDFECDDISVDVQEVGRMQARHLIELGHRRICLANTVPEARITVLRQDAIRQVLTQAGAPTPLEMRLPGTREREVVEAEALLSPMRTFIEKHRGAFDAIIGSDYTASLAVRILHELGLRIPQDVAVVGGGDSILTSYGEVPLTSINAENDAAGAQAFGLLMDRIEGRWTGGYRRLINPARLIVRESTRK